MDKKLKINILFPYNVVGGAFKSTYEISNRLTALNYDIVIYYPFFPSLEGKSFFSYKGLYLILGGLLRSLIRGKKIYWFDCVFKTKQIPIIHNIFIRDADIVIANHWQTAKKVFNLSTEKGRKYYFIRDIEQWNDFYHRQIDAFKLDMDKLVVSDWINEFLINELNLPPSKVVNNGLNFEVFENKNKDYSKKKLTISFLYSTHPMKGGDEGLEILREIKKNFKDLEIIIFGFVKPKNINKDFDFVSRPIGADLRNIYAKSDIFLWTSFQEGWGNPPLEAMASKCALVASRTGSIEKIIKNDVNGFSFHPKDFVTAKRQIEKLLVDKNKRMQISEQGSLDIQKFSWDEPVKILNNIFKANKS